MAQKYKDAAGNCTQNTTIGKMGLKRMPQGYICG